MRTQHQPGNDKTADPPKLAYRVDEACRALGIGRTSLYELIGQQKLKTALIAGRRVIPAAELARIIQEGMQ